jgi:sec-independent protein translocase protein TatA
MPFRMGGPELIILLVVVMIIFGVGKLPQVGGALGKAMRDFRKAQSGEEVGELGELDSPGETTKED